jgi:hypothetical protein
LNILCLFFYFLFFCCQTMAALPVPFGAAIAPFNPLRVHIFPASEFVKEIGDESACRQRAVASAMAAYHAWVGRNAARPITVETLATGNNTTVCSNGRLLMESIITVTYRGDDNA